jgi:DUF4097 and DUF4098 domain-containing protein YvlB
MRRTSVVAPLLLIAIGGLFLARNLYPEVPLLDYLAKYWPFLLIVWGVLRLAEVLFWSASDQPIPRVGVSGGEWVLVVFLCIFGGSLHAIRGANNNWWPNFRVGGLDMLGESYDFPIDGQKQTGKTPHVVIEAFRGNARINGVDTDTVKVTGHRSIRSLEQKAADNANQSMPFEITGDTGTVTIDNNQDRLSGNNVSVSAEMEITVPKGASIEAHGRYGDFDITDINGAVEVVSDNAGVRLQNIGGAARVDLRRSDVVRAVNVKGLFDLKGRGADVDLQNIEGPVTIAGAYSGVIQFRNLSKPLRFTGERTELNIEKLPGQVRMALGDLTASNLVGPIHLSTRSRDVEISDFTNPIEISVDRGDIDLRPGVGPLAHIDATTRNGDITLSLPGAAKFDLTAGTARGDVTNDYGSPIRAENDGRGAELRGVSPGGPVITAHTEHGTVVVRKASPDDKPAGSKQDSTGTDIPSPDKPLKKVEQ